MLKRVLFRAAAVAAAVALSTGSARADFVIDDFTTPASSSGFIAVPASNSASQTDNLASQGTPTRVLTVTETARTATAAETRYQVGGGTLTLSTVNSTANINAQYTYATGQDLSVGGTTIQFTFDTADFGVPYSIQLTSGSGASAVSVPQSGTTTTGGGVYGFRTDSFVGAGFDLTNITSVLLSLNRNLTTGGGDVTSADFTLSDVRVLTPTIDPPAVPAPPAAVLVLAAIPLLGLARARRLLPV